MLMEVAVGVRSETANCSDFQLNLFRAGMLLADMIHSLVCGETLFVRCTRTSKQCVGKDAKSIRLTLKCPTGLQLIESVAVLARFHGASQERTFASLKSPSLE